MYRTGRRIHARMRRDRFASRGASLNARYTHDSVELVVTSLPYPMIEMWDELFLDLNSDVGTHLANGDGQAAFAKMREELGKVWEEVSRVLVDGVSLVSTSETQRGRWMGAFVCSGITHESSPRSKTSGSSRCPNCCGERRSIPGEVHELRDAPAERVRDARTRVRARVP
jgi:hypothetical protein